jgi:archaeal flagellin FlaB
MKNCSRGLISLYGTGITAFFIIAVVMVIIFVNIGFEVNDAQKQVVDEALDEVDERFVVAGKISGRADVSLFEILATATPVRTVSDGSVNVDPQILTISYELTKSQNQIIKYENIYTGFLKEKSYNSLEEAAFDAKNNGLIDNNPYVDELKLTTTKAFFYWIINQNFDNYVDNNELAVLAIVYADKDRPSTGEQLFIQADVPQGYVLQIDQDVPSISSETVNFGGIVGGR